MFRKWIHRLLGCGTPCQTWRTQRSHPGKERHLPCFEPHPSSESSQEPNWMCFLKIIMVLINEYSNKDEWKRFFTKFHGVDPSVDIKDQIHFERQALTMKPAHCNQLKNEFKSVSCNELARVAIMTKGSMLQTIVCNICGLHCSVTVKWLETNWLFKHDQLNWFLALSKKYKCLVKTKQRCSLQCYKFCGKISSS